jgi:hypothetical protein
MQDAADPNILTNILIPSHSAALLNFEKRNEKIEGKNNGRAAACRGQMS